MRREDFAPGFPGALEPTTFIEAHWKDGVRQTRTVQGIGFVPSPLPPKLDLALLVAPTLRGPWLAAEKNLSLLEGIGRQMKNPHLLIRPLSLREARLSSAIENTFASAEQLALFEFDPTVIANRDEVREVFNYVRALEHGLNSELPVCLRLLREMHAILLEGVADKNVEPGEFRTTQNAIGRQDEPFERARFAPPPPRFLRDCLDRFEAYLHAEDDLPNLIRLAVIHYQFEAIHPFDDGNGRLGRLIIALLLCKQNEMSSPLVYISGYFEKHRQRYYDLLHAVSTTGAWIEWIAFFLEALAVQALDAADRASRLAGLRDSYNSRVREKRASALLPQIVDQLFIRPSITVAEVMRLTGVNAGPASKVIERLKAKGILIEATGRKKNRVYVAPEILEVIDT